AFEPAGARRFQRRPNFRRMVAVVVDDGHTVRGTANLKPAIHTAETCQSLSNTFEWNFELKANRDGRGRVQNVVRARNIQTKTAQVGSAILDLKLAAHGNCRAPDNTQVRLRALSVRNRPPVYLRQNLLNVFVVQTQNSGAIEWDLGDELLKCP